MICLFNILNNSSLCSFVDILIKGASPKTMLKKSFLKFISIQLPCFNFLFGLSLYFIILLQKSIIFLLKSRQYATKLFSRAISSNSGVAPRMKEFLFFVSFETFFIYLS